MSVEITVADVIALYPQAANVDPDIVQMYIDVTDKADLCLNGSDYPDSIIKAIKLNTVAFFLFLTSGYGNASSMRSPTGESVSFRGNGAHDFSANSYGHAVMMLDKNQCMISALDRVDRFFVSVGGDC